MVDIPLRAYQRKIESLIEENDIEKAIFQSGLLIKQFPKNIQSWQCLSKALLQKQEFELAERVFDIILNIEVDDFVSHIGKSIAAENRALLEDAIAHMFRAFEIQPTNEGLQNEIKRLIKKKDGIEPNKIHLTRGALIKMYLRGELYEQALSEARIGIQEHPDKIDFQITLAESSLKTGDYMKAIDTCIAILNKLPYCRRANEIMVELLNQSIEENIAEIYVKRLTELDPYYAYKLKDTPSILDVPDIAVMVKDCSDELTEPVEIPQLIAMAWENEKQEPVNYAPADWESVIAKAVMSSQMKIDTNVEEYEDAVIEHKVGILGSTSSISSPNSRKAHFLKKLKPTSSQSEAGKVSEGIVDYQDEFTCQESSGNAENPTSLPYSETIVADENEAIGDEMEPTFPQTVEDINHHALWVNELEEEDIKESSAENSSLEDTQQIQVSDSQPAYLLDQADKAINEKNYPYAIQTLRNLSAHKEYFAEISNRLEHIAKDSPEINDLLLLLGELYTNQDKWVEAQEIFKKAQGNIFS